ncbi:type II toxin-antitoxin system RelE/ParE family toxin [Dyadobacter luticola]|uniref:Plasmid maintenance system killer n=1 Tax=Dyadobacter luticola TaxID=1979387 RepID=A0A5R9KRI1_9BACT|nr:type II toxin-antitoxin system RelE/ParE family toxin [Dyadobacter luticola]TLU98895.1 plasmid maintenance system killer [Dyadobacter luticola]
MIKSINSKPLKLFYQKDDGSKLPASQLGKIGMILGLLDAAAKPEDMEFPGSGLHRLSGDYKDFWSVKVNANYRIIFKFEPDGVADVDYLDYH